MEWIGVANILAAGSVSEWNQSRLLRVICRWGYRALGGLYLAFSAEHRRQVRRYKEGIFEQNLYPKPYVLGPDESAWSYQPDGWRSKGEQEPVFAGWPETETTLVTDRGRFVIRRSTSFCYYMIKFVTGRWPKMKREPRKPGESWLSWVKSGCGRRERYDGKRWREYLARCGYTKTVPRVGQGYFYIGIDPNYGEYGQLYWLVAVPNKDGGRQVLAATYENFKFQCFVMSNTRLAKLDTIILIC